MKIKKIVKRILGHAEWKKPICDKFIYEENKKSYTGNSLSKSNVLVVTNMELQSGQVEAVKAAMQEEQSQSKYWYWNLKGVKTADIKAREEELIGPFEHIVNFISFVDVDITSIYQLLQSEMDYLIKYSKKGTICTAIVCDYEQESAEACAVKAALISLMSGLGVVSANHSIIENGIIASDKVEWKDVISSVLFLSSKYGQILNGNVLRMSEPL